MTDNGQYPTGVATPKRRKHRAEARQVQVTLARQPKPEKPVTLGRALFDMWLALFVGIPLLILSGIVIYAIVDITLFGGH